MYRPLGIRLSIAPPRELQSKIVASGRELQQTDYHFTPLHDSATHESHDMDAAWSPQGQRSDTEPEIPVSEVSSTRGGFCGLATYREAFPPSKATKTSNDLGMVAGNNAIYELETEAGRRLQRFSPKAPYSLIARYLRPLTAG